MSATNFEEFQKLFTIRLHGYSSTPEFYEHMSSVNHLHKVDIPLFCMNSNDDPILWHKSIPIEECQKNPNIVLMVTNTGGHVGWIHGLLRPRRWFPKPCVEFLNTVHELSHKPPASYKFDLRTRAKFLLSNELNNSLIRL